MPIPAAFLIALASCVPGVAAILTLRGYRAEGKKPIQFVVASTLFQFVATVVGLSVLPWDDGPDYDEYRGVWSLIASFIVFALIHALSVVLQFAKKAPNQPPQTTPLKRRV